MKSDLFLKHLFKFGTVETRQICCWPIRGGHQNFPNQSERYNYHMTRPPNFLIAPFSCITEIYNT